MKDSTQTQTVQEVTLKGTLINILLMVLKFAAAIFGTSAAMLADAVHSLSDFLTDIIVLIYVRLSRNRDASLRKFGRGTFETVSIIIIGLVILVVGFSICYSGVRMTIRAFQGEVLANAWHHRSDAISSIGTTIGIGCAIFLGAKWRVLDPITSVIVSIFVMSIAFHLLTDAVRNILWFRIPEHIEEQIEGIAKSEETVRQVNNIFVRRLGSNLLVRLHITVDENMTVGEAHQHVLNIEDKIRQAYGPDTNVGIFIGPKS